jgi:hypothetical protein
VHKVTAPTNARRPGAIIEYASAPKAAGLNATREEASPAFATCSSATIHECAAAMLAFVVTLSLYALEREIRLAERK